MKIELRNWILTEETDMYSACVSDNREKLSDEIDHPPSTIITPELL